MKKNATERVFILDKSGSMAGLESDTIGGFNAMLQKQKALPGECRITTVLFDNCYELLHDRIDIRALNPMTEREYQVGGATALLDAIGRTIHKLVSVQRNTAEAYRAEKVMFVIITDGAENASREYSIQKVRSMIEHEKEKYGWEFLFLGANMDAVETAGRFGIAPDRAVDYVPDEAGTELNFRAMSETVACFRATGAVPRRTHGGHPQGHEEKRMAQMIGAIVGDIVGSVYEWNNIKTKEFPFFQDKCFFTDDTVMTIAVAAGLMKVGKKDDFIDAMKKYGRMYPDAGYGGRFGAWLFSDSREPYHSWGNGSAMRVSPVGWWFDTMEETRRMAALAASVTHDHPEGIKGAESTAAAIFLARTGHSKAEIKDYVEREFGYDLSRTLDEIRPDYRFNESCQDTVSQAITAFLESTDFEDAIRNAISLGGDSDTLAAITGSIAEAAYGVPQWIQDQALGYLDEPLREVLRCWQKELSRR